MNTLLHLFASFGGTNPLEELTLLGLCSVRLLVIMSMFPPTGDRVLQGVVRNGVAMLFSSFIAYGQPASLLSSLSGATLILLVLKETAIGLLLGMSASVVFWVAESAGIYVDDLTGYNHAQISNPSNDQQSTPTGTLLLQIANVSFWSFGGMMFLLGALYDSYYWWPMNSLLPVPSHILESFALHQADTIMLMVAKLAAPLLFVLVLVDLAFGFVERSAEKLELSTMSYPVKGAVTVLLLALFVGVFVDQVKDLVSLHDLSAQLRALAGQMKH